MDKLTYAFLIESLKEDISASALEQLIAQTKDERVFQYLSQFGAMHAAVFLGWIQQWPALEEILTEDSTAISYMDRLKVEQHTLFAEFQSFVSPFLFEPILGRAQMGVVDETAGYLRLLSGERRLKVETTYFPIVSSQIDHVFEILNNKKSSEEQLIDALHEVLNQQVIDLLNAFSKRSYANVIQYVERLIQVVNHPDCPYRVSVWIITHLEKLHLNPEHVQQISDLKSNVNERGIVTSRRNIKFWEKMKPWYTTIGLSFFVVLVFTLIWLKPWSEKQENENDLQLASSFAHFTLEERQHLDSLLKTYEVDPVIEHISIDEIYNEGREIMVDTRPPAKNEAVEAYYQTWDAYLKSDSVASEKTCKDLSKANGILIPELFTQLKEKKGSHLVYLLNDSDVDIHLLVYSNKSGAKAFFKLVKSQEDVEFKIEPQERIAIISGKYTIAPSVNKNGQVFCEIDQNTIASLVTVYECKQTLSMYNKLLVSNSGGVQLMDLQGILEKVK